MVHCAECLLYIDIGLSFQYKGETVCSTCYDKRATAQAKIDLPASRTIPIIDCTECGAGILTLGYLYSYSGRTVCLDCFDMLSKRQVYVELVNECAKAFRDKLYSMNTEGWIDLDLMRAIMENSPYFINLLLS